MCPKALMEKGRRTFTWLTLLGRVMLSGELIHSLHAPAKAYPHS
jgi:hypothetical protein